MSTSDNGSYNFSSGLSPNTTDDLNTSGTAGLVGANAGTLPNGYQGNYTPPSSLSGVSAGAQNGNYSFGMPGSSMSQLQSQSLNPTALSNALAAGAKIQQPQQGPRPPAGPGRVAMHQAVFSNPIQNFAGSIGGTDSGNSLIALLSKYHPGASQ